MEELIEKLFNELDLMNEEINDLFQKGLIAFIFKNNIDLFQLIDILKKYMNEDYHPYFDHNEILNILYKIKYKDKLKETFDNLLEKNNFKDIKLLIKNISQIENGIDNINKMKNEFEILYSKKLIEITLQINFSNKEDSEHSEDSEDSEDENILND